MGGPAATGRFPLLALVLAVFMVGYVMWQADRLPARAQPQPAPPSPGTDPGAGPASGGRRPSHGGARAATGLACPPAASGHGGPAGVW